MKFVDSIKIHVRSGSGGAGCSSFRREKYIPFGGPDGGDGGDGGNICFVGDSQKNTLLDLSFQQHQHAENGKSGQGRNQHGKKGNNCVIPVPLGTVIKDPETEEILLEIVEKKEYSLLQGGRGGRGNARFKTSTNRVPEYHQPGEVGTELWLRLELKLMADIGLVGLPNAGKSTLISSISQAKPKIADYPFTTLVPQLGVVQCGNFENFVVADIPGIIAGAHQGRGLGDRFLRHIERTSILLLLLDVSGFAEQSPLAEYHMLLQELQMYAPSLAEKPRFVALTKMDTVHDLTAVQALEESLQKKKEIVFRISSVNRSGLKELVITLAKAVNQQKKQSNMEEYADRDIY